MGCRTNIEYESEGKAKVVAAGWGTKLNAALAIYVEPGRFEEKDEKFWKKMIILFTPHQTTTLPKWMAFRKLFFKSSFLPLNSFGGIQACHPISSGDLCLSFWVILILFVHNTAYYNNSSWNIYEYEYRVGWVEGWCAHCRFVGWSPWFLQYWSVCVYSVCAFSFIAVCCVAFSLCPLVN